MNVNSATQEEIKTYEAALTFHEHGRVPFVVEEGYLLEDDKDNLYVVSTPSIRTKEDFTSGRYTFLNTAEEVNEWARAEDEWSTFRKDE